MLHARIASALNKISENSFFRKRSVWRDRKLRKKIGSFAEDRFPYMIYDNFRAIGARDTVLDYADLFTITSQ